jgi:FtsZ-binding cell division protein ZapB
MRENNPFADTSTPTDGSTTADQASANALDALNEPKKSGFWGALKNRKKPAETPPAPDSPQAAATDFPSSDTAYQPLINETQAPASTAAQAPEPPQPSQTNSGTFKKTPPIAIDGVSPDYSNASPDRQATAQFEQPAPTGARYEDFQPAEQPYAPAPEQPMIYQQPAQDYYQPQPDPYLTNQPLPVNYGATPNIYDPYNPYATMVDLNPTAPDPNKKPDWKFVITFSIAIICFAGMIFFAISYAAANNNSKEIETDLLDLQNKSVDSSKAASQVEDLQNTVRELTSKNETLKESNDSLKKNEDKVKELETTNTTLQTDRQAWMDKYYEVLTKCGDKCVGGSSSSSSD